MYAIYESWRHFPNESSFDMVKRLYEAIVDVKAMQKEEKQKTYAGDIAKQRKKIQELQDKIAKLEKSMNSLYEKAADAMNLLEEHGVDMNAIDEIAAHDDPVDITTVDDYNNLAVHTFTNSGLLSRRTVQWKRV